MALYLVKAAILLLYFRLFPPDHIKLRRALYVTTAITALGSLLMMCFNLFWCLPVWRNWAKNPEDRCLGNYLFGRIIIFRFFFFFHFGGVEVLCTSVCANMILVL